MAKTKEKDGIIKYHVNRRVRTLTLAGNLDLLLL